MEKNKEQWKLLEDDYAPENKFTQKEVAKGIAENDSFESNEIDEGEESEEDIEMSNIDHKIRNSTDQATRKHRYTHNSSTPNKNERMSTF